MKYIMFEHAGSRNHGCEAIVRSTIDMLGSNDYYLETKSPGDDVQYGIDKLAHIIPTCEDPTLISPRSIRGLLWRLEGKFNHSLDFDDRERLYRHRKLIYKDACALSIGGDNYCYRGIIGSMRDKLKVYQHKEIPTVLWGCSIGSDYLDDNVINDLKMYDLISARESLTEELLYQHGIRDTVVGCSDPAFTLKREFVSWNDEVMGSGNVIGINVSDFMTYYNAYPEATFRNFIQLVDYILKNTDRYIALIPHVRHPNNDDLVPINKIASHFNSSRILVLDEDYNCMQIKDVIAKCGMFIGCRTHSTIAAYSSCIPTLVVGYSIKAKGICKDIFGGYDDLLVDVRNFQNDNYLLNCFLLFSEREDELRKHLKAVMPAYIQRAYNSRDTLLAKFS